MAGTQIDPEDVLTSHQVGELLRADPSSVQNWVERGWLKAFRTPGGHRRIRAADLVRFLVERGMPVPERLSFKRRLMLVDDQPRELRAFQRLLAPYEERIEVCAIDNGIDALIRVGSFKPELIVLDVLMPGIDGIEVLRKLKSNPDTSHVVVIVASGRWSPELEAKALEAGALSCVPKPIELKQIISALGIERESLAAG
jgi:excisionase family DNA binding protein